MIRHYALFLALFLGLLAFLPSAAQAQGSLVPGKSRENRGPIEVTSDTLEVLQQENKAIFSGHVVAIQGGVRLKADKMTVHYASQDEKDKKAASKGEAGAIRRIDAEGSVFLSTAEETASGATGVYDVEKEEIRLNDKVVLTRGKNVLKGSKLTYNFATGKSKLTSAAGTAGAAEAGRVRALFVPEDNTGGKAEGQAKP